MLREIQVGGIKWIDAVDLKKQDIYDVLDNYSFHELDIEACLEENQRARIDSYEDYFFTILHFPKYNQKTKVYELNEFNVFVGKDFLITFRNFWGNHIDQIFEKYQSFEENYSDGEEMKISSWYILYEIIQVMLEKMFKVINNVRQDIRLLEKQVFDHVDPTLVRDIMIKKRNIILLKNMFKPQLWVMASLESSVNKLFLWEIELYFEDLQDKTWFIYNDVELMEEYIISIEDAYKTMIDIQTWNIIRFLTIFSAFHLPLTLITWFYGMNVENLPFQHSFVIVILILTSTFATMVLLYYVLNKKGKM
jgi:magnesium transporter